MTVEQPQRKSSKFATGLHTLIVSSKRNHRIRLLRGDGFKKYKKPKTESSNIHTYYELLLLCRPNALIISHWFENKIKTPDV